MRSKLGLVMLFAAAVAVAVFVAGCGSDDEGTSGPTFSAVDFYPLGVGAHWTFVNDSGDSAYSRIEDTLTISDHLVYRMIYTEPGETDTTLASVINGGIYVYIPDLDSFLCFLPPTFSVGQSWVIYSFDSTGTSGGFNFHYWYEWRVKVMGTETITVPAGTFDAVKFVSVLENGYSVDLGDSTSDDVDVDTDYVWLARGVGEVKNVESDGTSWGLVDYFVGTPAK